MMLEDYCLNGSQVIDIISYYELGDIMSHPKVSININNIWTSPYEFKYPFQMSSFYTLLKEKIFHQAKSFVDHDSSVSDRLLCYFKNPLSLF